MGGMIAQELALRHPAKVPSLTLLSSAARLDTRGRAVIESWGMLPGQVDAMTASRLILPWLYTDAFYSRPSAIDQVLDAIMACPHPPTLEGLEFQSRAISASDTSTRLSDIACPTLVPVGNEDVLLPVPFSQQMAERIPNARLFVLERTGHALLIESPEPVAVAMLEYLPHADK